MKYGLINCNEAAKSKDFNIIVSVQPCCVDKVLLVAPIRGVVAVVDLARLKAVLSTGCGIYQKRAGHGEAGERIQY